MTLGVDIWSGHDIRSGDDIGSDVDTGSGPESPRTDYRIRLGDSPKICHNYLHNDIGLIFGLCHVITAS